MSIVQGIALGCAAGVLATIAGMYVPTFPSSLWWLTQAFDAWRATPTTADPLASSVGIAFVAGVVLCALLTPVALYFTFRED